MNGASQIAMKKTIAQQQKDWEQKFHQTNSQILATTINSLNETTLRERNHQLSQFTTEALEQELLSRQQCHFGRLSCTEKPTT
jgi:hypothetical protein